MKNAYEVRGREAVVFLRRRDGSRLETRVDIDDLAIAEAHRGAWAGLWNVRTRSFYVVGEMRDGAGRHQAYLHRLIAGTPNGMVTDHINHDTLDNRRVNLRVVTYAQNSQNVSARRKNGSGVRGVTWHKGARKWMAQVKFAGRYHYLGLFNDLAEASRVASEFRARMMPFSLDAMQGVSK